MAAPGQGTTKGSQDVVPLDPFTRGHGTGLLRQEFRLEDRVPAGTQKDQGKHAQHTGRHLGHERTQDAGRRVFTFPVRFFRAQGHGRFKGRGGRAQGSGGHKGLHTQGKKSTKEEGELGHGDDTTDHKARRSYSEKWMHLSRLLVACPHQCHCGNFWGQVWSERIAPLVETHPRLTVITTHTEQNRSFTTVITRISPWSTYLSGKFTLSQRWTLPSRCGYVEQERSRQRTQTGSTEA